MPIDDVGKVVGIVVLIILFAPLTIAGLVAMKDPEEAEAQQRVAMEGADAIAKAAIRPFQPLLLAAKVGGIAAIPLIGLWIFLNR